MRKKMFFALKLAGTRLVYKDRLNWYYSSNIPGLNRYVYQTTRD